MFDWRLVGQDMAIREKMFPIITSVFKRHCGMALDTQVADSITGVYPSIHALVRGFKSGGTDILEDLPVCSC
jgi:hypothetical protein